MEFNTATSTPNVKLLEFLSNTEYKLILGKTKFIKNTNLKFNEPTIYRIVKLNIDILEYDINENNNKVFYIEKEKKTYNLQEIINFLKKFKL